MSVVVMRTIRSLWGTLIFTAPVSFECVFTSEDIGNVRSPDEQAGFTNPLHISRQYLLSASLSALSRAHDRNSDPWTFGREEVTMAPI